MPNIYYIEDREDHFKELSLLLKDSGYNVYPNEDDWETEMDCFVNFLDEQSSKENRKVIEGLLDKYQVDLLIIDIDLGMKDSGDGEDIYKNCILKSDKYYLLPVIYLTVIGRSSIKLYNRTKYVGKVLKKLNELDTEAIKDELLNSISVLLKKRNDRGFLNNLIDSL